MFKQIALASTTAIAISLSACGGGSGGSSSSNSNNGSAGEPTLDSSDLGAAATTLSKQIISREGNSGSFVPGFGKPSASTPQPQVANKTAFDAISVSFTTSETTTTEGDCGGSVITDFTITADDQTLYPYSGELDAQFIEYCERFDVNGEVVINGSISNEFNFPNANEGSISWHFDLAYVSNHPNLMLSGSYEEEVSCTYTDGVSFDLDSDSCTTSFVYSEDDVTYRTESVIVTGNNSVGYDVDFEFADEDNTYDVSLTGITVCENGNLGSGMGTVSVNDESITLDFISCDSVTITYNGESETIAQ